MDLNQASREALLEIIAKLRQRVESLEARLSGGGPGVRMPGHKPAAKRKKPAAEEKKPRKKRQHGFARPRMEPIGRVVHAPESCPECHTALTGGWAQRTREVIDIPVVPAEVTEHVFIARTCPLCRKRRLPQDPLKGLAVGRRRFGANLVGLIVTLREEGRLPVRTIQWYLRMFHQLKLSVGAIVRAVHQSLPRTRYGVARQAGPEVDEALERIRCSPVVHADETGWRENGKTATSGPPVGALTGVCMGFSCRGMVGDLQVELGFRPGFGQQPDPAPEPAPEQQPPQPVNAVADYADGPARPAPTAVVSGRQVFRRRSQVAGSNPPVIGVFHPPVVAGGRLWSHRPGSATSPPPTPANAAKSAPGRFYGSYPISIPGS